MLSIIYATYRKNRIGILRAVPWSFLFSRVITGVTQIVFPWLLYHFYLRGRLAESFFSYTGTNDYITYVVLGSAFNVLAVATLMNIGRALITELREGTLEPLLLSPASRTGYFLGCLLEQTSRALLEFFLVMLTGWLLGADLSRLFRPEALAVILLAVFSFFCMGLSLSAVMLKTRDTYLSQNTLFNAMSLVCGIMFPLAYLPAAVQRLAQLFPLTSVVELFRRAMLGGQSLGENFPLLLQTLGLALAYLLAGAFCYRRMERKLIESVFG